MEIKPQIQKSNSFWRQNFGEKNSFSSMTVGLTFSESVFVIDVIECSRNSWTLLLNDRNTFRQIYDLFPS